MEAEWQRPECHQGRLIRVWEVFCDSGPCAVTPFHVIRLILRMVWRSPVGFSCGDALQVPCLGEIEVLFVIDLVKRIGIGWVGGF